MSTRPASSPFSALSVYWISIVVFYHYELLITSAISVAISSTVNAAVFLANLSANEGEKSITSFLVILCHIGKTICSPDTAFVIIPSNS